LGRLAKGLDLTPVVQALPPGRTSQPVVHLLVGINPIPTVVTAAPNTPGIAVARPLNGNGMPLFLIAGPSPIPRCFRPSVPTCPEPWRKRTIGSRVLPSWFLVLLLQMDWPTNSFCVPMGLFLILDFLAQLSNFVSEARVRSSFPPSIEWTRAR
jgi:hypothetical protein